MWHVCERKEKSTRFWWESPKERDHSEVRGIDGRMGLEWILGRLVLRGGGGGVDSPGLGLGLMAGFHECNDEPLSSGTTELVNS
jgi:hypothetical protein